MQIEVNGFIIKTSEGITKFDLYQKVELKTGARAGKTLEKTEAFGVSFKRALLIIVQRTMDSDLGTIDIDTYISKYEKATEALVEKVEKIIKEK